MKEYQFRGKLRDNTFLVTSLDMESSLFVAHLIHSKDNTAEEEKSNNIFFDSSSDREELGYFQFFEKKETFSPFIKEMKAPFNKYLFIRKFYKNGNLDDVIRANEELEEIYMSQIFGSLLNALTFCHSHNLCNLGFGMSQIEIGDEGQVLFPYYYELQKISIEVLLQEIHKLQSLTKKVIKNKKFSFEMIEKSRFSNKFKDFLKAVFQNFGFKESYDFIGQTSNPNKK
jgi:hypothetical protein